MRNKFALAGAALQNVTISGGVGYGLKSKNVGGRASIAYEF